MNITNPPEGAHYDADGRPTPDARVFQQQMVSQLQENLSDERYKLPAQPAANVTRLNNAVDTNKNTGGILFNSTSKSAMVNTHGSFKNIVTYEEMTSAQVLAIPSGERNGRIIYETDSFATKLGSNDTFITL